MSKWSLLAITPVAALVVFTVLDACVQNQSGSIPGASAPAVEWVSYHTEVPYTPAAFDALTSGLFGANAQSGKMIADQELAPGVYVKSVRDPSTNDQTQLTFSFDDGTNPRRPLAVAPASFSIGQLFITTVDAAVAKMTAQNAAQPGSGEMFLLEYRVTSAMGGHLSLAFRGNLGVYTMALDISSPPTSLTPGQINTPAANGAPFDTVAGTVWFHLTKDDFDFFVDRAYGKGATSKQNFTDFSLSPHEWLHLTVVPHLDQRFVSVNFDVITVAGQRVRVASAPASVDAGDAFHSLVSSSMGRMLAQEKAQPGSSSPWSSPFYYDNPQGGGVVQVIAEGKAGIFDIAYAIESPRHPLRDVSFLPFQTVNIPPPDPNQTASCQMLGFQPAPKGSFNMTFTASNVVTRSAPMPLVGTIYCSIYKQSDVTGGGPVPGATSILDFTVPNANLSATTPTTYTSPPLWAGDYQILCGQDIHGTGKVGYQDPVTLPIGGYTVACDKNPVTVEFAILDPQM